MLEALTWQVWKLRPGEIRAAGPTGAAAAVGEWSLHCDAHSQGYSQHPGRRTCSQLRRCVWGKAGWQAPCWRMRQGKAPFVSLPWLLSKKPRVLCRCSSMCLAPEPHWLADLPLGPASRNSVSTCKQAGGRSASTKGAQFFSKEHISKEPSGLAAVSGPLSTQTQRSQGFITNGPVRPAASFSVLYLIQPWQCFQRRTQACTSQCHRWGNWGSRSKLKNDISGTSNEISWPLHHTIFMYIFTYTIQSWAPTPLKTPNTTRSFGHKLACHWEPFQGANLGLLSDRSCTLIISSKPTLATNSWIRHYCPHLVS